MIEKERLQKDLTAFEAFQNLAEALPNIVWTCTPDGQTEYVNQAWYEYTGLSEDDALELGWSDLLHPDDREKALALFSAFVSGKIETYEVESRFRNKDGSYRWFTSRAIPVRDSMGVIVKWFGTTTDIHEEKSQQMEAEASKSKLAEEIEARKRLQQFREDVLAHLSHDIRNNLLGQMRVIEHLIKVTNNEQAIEILNSMRAGNVDALMTVSKLIDVDKYAFAGQSLFTKRLNLSTLVRSNIESISSLANSAGVALSEDIEEDLEMIGDEESLGRLVLNLLHNGVQFTPDGGHIKVSLHKHDQELHLEVSDSGIGIPEQEQEDLFARFWKGDRPRQFSIGKGFGLYLCRQITEAHHGEITCKSAIRNGTTFLVILPAFLGS